MPLADFLLHVFCLVDDLYRQIGRRPHRSLPIRACAFGRAGFARRLRGDAGYGRDHTRRGLMYGSGCTPARPRQVRSSRSTWPRPTSATWR